MPDFGAILPSLMLGIALSASAGFRVFVPLLLSNLAGKFGAISISNDFSFMTSNSATLILGVACVLEIGSYYITYVDNLLDSIALPISVVAGTLLTTQFLDINDPVLKWSLGIIAGGGVAGTVQSSTTLLRLASTKFTAGFGNKFISTIENFLSVIISLISIWLPILMGILALLFTYSLLKRLFKSKSVS
jgi:hypothetical protein